MYLLPEFSDHTFEAFEGAKDSIGEPATDRFASYLSMDSSDLAGNFDVGLFASLVTDVDDEERVAFALLQSFARSSSPFDELDVDPWTEEVTGSCFIVYGNSQGFHDVEWFKDEDKARAHVQSLDAAWNEDEEDDDEEEPINPYEGPGGLLDEIRQAERELGTE